MTELSKRGYGHWDLAAPATILSDLPRYVREAVKFYWETRAKQTAKQLKTGERDQGSRSAVTGGAQMDGFIELLAKLVIEAGIDRSHIYYRESLELPGYFRPTKQWDFLVIVKDQLVAALEAKSQVGPSFGNNFNNRTEEAMGSALDLWTAFRENASGAKRVRGWAISFCSMIARDRRRRWESRSRISRCSRSFGIRRTPGVMNCFAAGWCWRGIMIRRLLFYPMPRWAKRVDMRSQRRI